MRIHFRIQALLSWLYDEILFALKTMFGSEVYQTVSPLAKFFELCNIRHYLLVMGFVDYLLGVGFVDYVRSEWSSLQAKHDCPDELLTPFLNAVSILSFCSRLWSILEYNFSVIFCCAMASFTTSHLMYNMFVYRSKFAVSWNALLVPRCGCLK